MIAPTLTKKPWTAGNLIVKIFNKKIDRLNLSINECETTEEEERLIELHEVFGKMWAHIASQLPGRSGDDDF